MKLAISAKGPDWDSPVDPRFGRAKYFVVIDAETGELTAADNSLNVNALQGAGIQSGQNVIDLEVEAVITGSVGPKAFSTLQAGGVKAFLGASGTVQEAFEQFKAGRLQAASQANAESHWI